MPEPLGIYMREQVAHLLALHVRHAHLRVIDDGAIEFPELPLAPCGRPAGWVDRDERRRQLALPRAGLHINGGGTTLAAVDHKLEAMREITAPGTAATSACPMFVTPQDALLSGHDRYVCLAHSSYCSRAYLTTSGPTGGPSLGSRRASECFTSGTCCSVAACRRRIDPSGAAGSAGGRWDCYIQMRAAGRHTGTLLGRVRALAQLIFNV